MPWIKVSFERFAFGRQDGLLPSFAFGWFRLSWWNGTYDTLIMTMRAALKAARDELRLGRDRP